MAGGYRRRWVGCPRSGPAGGRRGWETTLTDTGASVDDAYLVQRAQEGYVDAYEELVSRHGLRVYRTALRMLGNHHDAEDIAQDALITGWHRLEQFRGQSAFSTWMYRIVTRLALNRLQRTKKTESIDLLDDVADEETAHEHAERNLTVDAVSQAIGELPVPQRIVVVLHHFEGLSYAEVATITQSTVPAVRSHLFRARRTLALKLGGWR